jgi:hypothetical protein
MELQRLAQQVFSFYKITHDSNYKIMEFNIYGNTASAKHNA